MQNYHISILWIAYRIYVQFAYHDYFLIHLLKVPKSSQQYSGTWRQILLYFTRSEKNEEKKRGKKWRQKKNLVRHQFESLPITVHAIFAQNAHLLSPPLQLTLVVFFGHIEIILFFFFVLLWTFFSQFHETSSSSQMRIGWWRKHKKCLFFISFSVIFFFSFFFRNKLHFISANWIFAVVILASFLFFNSNAMTIPS